jgi:hypothetical protein
MESTAQLEEKFIREARQNLKEDLIAVEQLPEKVSLDEIAGRFLVANGSWQRFRTSLEQLGPAAEEIGESRHKIQLVSDRLHTLLMQEENHPGLANSSVPREHSRTYSDLTNQLERMKKENYSIAPLIRKLDLLHGQFLDLEEKIEQAISQADIQQNRIQNLSTRVEEAIQRWKTQADIYEENQIASREIAWLLQETEGEQQKLADQFQRDRISYQRYMERLTGLHRRLEDARIPIGNNQHIYINGEISGFGT